MVEGGSHPADDYTVPYYYLETGFFVYKEIIIAVKRVEQTVVYDSKRSLKR
jgi:hypothetical protein